MRFVFYTHSLVSDWNHGNAHFQRGICRELVSRGHDVVALEPKDGWSRGNLLREGGEEAAARLTREYPELSSTLYDGAFDHDAALRGADVVVVHEWTPPALVAHIGRLRRQGSRFTLLFHDTHHRAVSARREIADLILEDYDAVLAFGETLRERYLQAGWGRRVYTWHEAADTTRFVPLARRSTTSVGTPAAPVDTPAADELIWIGNWGDGERAREMSTFLIDPARNLGLSGNVHGVRYPQSALSALAGTRLTYRGWLANYDVPAAFARHQVTVHVPRGPYVESLPGIPTIRVFEALACGIPLVCAPWEDSEGLFRPGQDYLLARDGSEMERHLRSVLRDPELARSLTRSGLETIRNRHTCRHRVDELLDVIADVSGNRTRQSGNGAPVEAPQPSAKEAAR